MVSSLLHLIFDYPYPEIVRFYVHFPDLSHFTFTPDHGYLSYFDVYSFTIILHVAFLPKGCHIFSRLSSQSYIFMTFHILLLFSPINIFFFTSIIFPSTNFDSLQSIILTVFKNGYCRSSFM